jgi:hypothetical protein
LPPWSILHSPIERKGAASLARATTYPTTQEAEMDRLAEMAKYVRQKNIDRYRMLLGEPTDPARRQQLLLLLAELETPQQ